MNGSHTLRSWTKGGKKMASAEQLKFELLAVDRASRPIQQVQGRVRNFDRQIKKSSIQMNNFGGSVTGAQKSLRKFAMGGIQQAGYQIGDYAVQVANGTSATQAFGQQAGQFLQIFGPFGAVLGAAVSVFAAVKMGMDKMSEAAGNADNAIKQLKESTKSLNEEAAAFALGVDTAEEAKAIKEITRLREEADATYAKYLKAVTDGSVGEIAKYEEIYFEKLKIVQAKQAEVDANRKAKKSIEDLTSITEQYLAQQMAAASAIGQLKKAESERTQAAIVAAGEQRALMAETTRRGLENAEKLKQGYAEYYASRLQGEAMLTRGGVQGGRGADPRQFTFLDEYLAQIAAGRKAKDEADEAAQAGTKKTAKTIKTELSPELMKIKDAAEMVGSSFESAMMSMVDGTMTAENAFKSMARNIIAELYRIYVVKQITGFISSAIGLMGGPNPFAFKAIGGPVQSDKPYVVGERGPEMFVPSRSGSIVPNNKLGGGGGVIVNQVINVSTGVQQTVRAEIKQLMPQIADSAKAAVVDAKRRGGSYGKAFA